MTKVVCSRDAEGDDYRLSPRRDTFRNCHLSPSPSLTQIDNIQFMLSSIIQQLIYVSNWQSLFKMFSEWKISIWPPRSFSLASRRLLSIIMQRKRIFCIKRNYWNLFQQKELEEIGIIINRANRWPRFTSFTRRFTFNQWAFRVFLLHCFSMYANAIWPSTRLCLRFFSERSLTSLKFQELIFAYV